MLEKGLAYRKKAPVNWCERCQSVLANEESEGGKCWRCGEEVTKKEMEQWFFKITAYADKLLESNHAYKKDGALYFKSTLNEFEDFVIIKSNGYPVFHFAVVIDDALQGLPHGFIVNPGSDLQIGQKIQPVRDLFHRLHTEGSCNAA